MRILALVPARRGSKRLPGKNSRPLGGKPLIVWSIEAAQGIAEICDILVSTDDPKIAAISEAAGVSVPWLRPSTLATDSATSVDVAVHALDWYEGVYGSVDGLLLLQPTSPFRSPAVMRRGIALFAKHGHSPVVGVSEVHAHPLQTMKIDRGFLVPFLEGQQQTFGSPDLSPAYALNGNFYLIAPTDLRRQRSFVGERTVPLVIESRKESLDIDTEYDWLCATAFLGRP